MLCTGWNIVSKINLWGVCPVSFGNPKKENQTIDIIESDYAPGHNQTTGSVV